MKMKLYTLELSTRRTITIDEEDYLKFFQYSASGNFIKLKHGIVNPSYVTAITPKEEVKKEEISEGFIDDKTGKFVVTKINKDGGTLVDEMVPAGKLIKNP